MVWTFVTVYPNYLNQIIICELAMYLSRQVQPEAFIVFAIAGKAYSTGRAAVHLDFLRRTM